MIEFKQIICPVDFSESSVRALAHAAALARWYDAQLTVLHVVPTFEAMQVRGDLVRAHSSRDADAARTGARGDEPIPESRGSVVRVRLRSPESGDPQTTIIDQALSKKADLIVMGTHGRRGFKRLLLGSVTEAVLREAPCPVLTVPPHAPAGVSETVTFKRILCPIDFSPSALQALGFALDLARQADGLSRCYTSWSGSPKRSPERQRTSMFPISALYGRGRSGTAAEPWWPKNRGRGSRLTMSSCLGVRLARSFVRPNRNRRTSSSWAPREGAGSALHCLDRRRSRWSVARCVLC